MLVLMHTDLLLLFSRIPEGFYFVGPMHMQILRGTARG